jgi:hypothetical protein
MHIPTEKMFLKNTFRFIFPQLSQLKSRNSSFDSVAKGCTYLYLVCDISKNKIGPSRVQIKDL